MPAADVTLDTALRLRPDGLIGFGLGGPEVGVPRPQFKPHFEQAVAAGLRTRPARRGVDRARDDLGRDQLPAAPSASVTASLRRRTPR